MWRTVGLWRNRASSGQPAAFSLLYSFSFPSPSPFSSCLFQEWRIGAFLQATLLQLSVGFKHAHWGFGTVHVSAVLSDPSLFHWGLFVAVGEVSFHTALFFFVVFLVYFRIVWRARGKREVQTCWQRRHLKSAMWESLGKSIPIVYSCFLCSFLYATLLAIIMLRVSRILSSNIGCKLFFCFVLLSFCTVQLYILLQLSLLWEKKTPV